MAQEQLTAQDSENEIDNDAVNDQTRTQSLLSLFLEARGASREGRT